MRHDAAVMRQEPRWPTDEPALEFLTKTLSTDQWRALRETLRAEAEEIWDDGFGAGVDYGRGALEEDRNPYRPNSVD